MSSKTKTTSTKEEATPVLVPKLRFPGFDKPWSNDPLSKTLKEHKIKNTAGRDVFSVSMEYGIVNQIELLGRSYAAADTSHYTVGRRFDVVYTKSPLKAFPFGVVKQCKFDGEVALSPLYGVFTPPTPHVGLMIEAYFEAPNRSKDFLSPLCQKGAKNTLQITNTTFLSGRLPLPTQPAEQQKIAECLSSVDELIAVQARKVDALKTHKKGLMQQLFPREGETQPRLRFPEFQNAGEWVVKPLGEIFPITSSKRVHESDWTATGVPFYRAREIVALNKQESIQPLFISEELYSEFSKLTGEIREGHLLVTGVGSIGVPYLVKKGDRFYFKDGNIIWLKNDGKELIGDFLLRLYETDYVQKQLKKMADVGTVATYTIDNAKRTLAVFPTEKAEQQRIADCLTSLDDLIAAQSQKHEALKTHKKGLMQQLFPSPEES